MASSEIFLWRVVDARGRIRTESLNQNWPGICTGDGVHRVELHFKIRTRKQRFDELKVENLFGEGLYVRFEYGVNKF